MVDKLKNTSQYGDRHLIDDNSQSEPVFTWPILPPIVDAQENLRTQRPKSAKSVSSVVSVDSIQIKSTNNDDYSNKYRIQNNEITISMNLIMFSIMIVLFVVFSFMIGALFTFHFYRKFIISKKNILKNQAKPHYIYNGRII